METNPISQLAEQLAAGRISLDHFLRELARPKTADLGDVQLDLDRNRRCGYPEVVFGQGKSVESIERVVHRLRRLPRDRRPHQRRLWCEPGWSRCALGDAQ